RKDQAPAPRSRLPAVVDGGGEAASRRPGGVGPPRLPPLLLEFPPVLVEQAAVFPLFQGAEGRPAPMVDEDVFGADHAASSRAHPVREVVVLEHPDAEALLQPTDLIQ